MVISPVLLGVIACGVGSDRCPPEAPLLGWACRLVAAPPTDNRGLRISPRTFVLRPGRGTATDPPAERRLSAAWRRPRAFHPAYDQRSRISGLLGPLSTGTRSAPLRLARPGRGGEAIGRAR